MLPSSDQQVYLDLTVYDLLLVPGNFLPLCGSVHYAIC